MPVNHFVEQTILPKSTSQIHDIQTNSKCLNQFKSTPRNSTSNSGRHGSSSYFKYPMPRSCTNQVIDRKNIIDSQRRFSYSNYLKECKQRTSSKQKRYSNHCESHYIDDEENEMDMDLNYDEYDDDLFEDDAPKESNSSGHKPSNKEYLNSLSTASYIHNEIRNFFNASITSTGKTFSSSSNAPSSMSMSPIDLQKARHFSEKLPTRRNETIIDGYPYNSFRKNLNSEIQRQHYVASDFSKPTGISLAPLDCKKSVCLSTPDLTISSSSSSSSSSSTNNNDTSKHMNNTMTSSTYFNNNNLNKTSNKSKCVTFLKTEDNKSSSSKNIQHHNDFSQADAFNSGNDIDMITPPLPSTSKSVLNYESMHSNEILGNFSHFDLQSVFFNYDQLKVIKSTLHNLVNYKTGASAASFSSINSKPFVDFNISPTSLSSPHSPTVGKSNLNNNRSSLSASKYSLSESLLVEECPNFRVEVGGDLFKGLGLVEENSKRRMMKLNAINIMDTIKSNYKKEFIDLIEANKNEPFTIEFQDFGAYFYRYFFSSHDHSNYLGIDDEIGPVAISIKREKLYGDSSSIFKANSDSSKVKNINPNCNEKNYEYAYRIIFRSSDLNTLRGTILENELISPHISTSKGIPHKYVISNLFNRLNLNCLHLADSKVGEKLLEFDEQCIIKNHKIGVLLCKAGQSTEEEFYNNQNSTPALEEFLELLGVKVRLKGFNNYRGGLDNTSDTTGTHSYYRKFRDKEIMFHVSTMLPFSSNDNQQLTRKRHIGNDLVTIIFQEPGSAPFSPQTLRSQYQHIFIIVRAINPNTTNTQYSIAVSYTNDTPSFGPPLPKKPLFSKSKEFREFLLAKIVNADHVGLRCEKFSQIRMRTRNSTLNNLVEKYSTKTNIESCNNGFLKTNVMQKLNIFNFGLSRIKKVRSQSLNMFNASCIQGSNRYDDSLIFSLNKLHGGILWNVKKVEDYKYSIASQSVLGISKKYIFIVDAQQKSVLFSIGSNAVIGWTLNEMDNSFLLYFDQGEYINLTFNKRWELYMVIKRLESFTRGCKTKELNLEKKDCGQLGFNICNDGVITEVEPHSLAFYRGLKQGTRIVKIGNHFVINLNHEQMISLLTNTNFLNITFLVPFEDGSPRIGQDESYSLYAYLSTCSSLNERLIDSIKTSILNIRNAHHSFFNQSNESSLPSYSPEHHGRISNISNKNRTRLPTTACSRQSIEKSDRNSHNSFTNYLYTNNFSMPSTPKTNLRIKQADLTNMKGSVERIDNDFISKCLSTEKFKRSSLHKQTCDLDCYKTDHDEIDLSNHCDESCFESNGTEEILHKFIKKITEMEAQMDARIDEKVEKKIAHILEENKTLKQEISNVKDELLAKKNKINLSPHVVKKPSNSVQSSSISSSCSSSTYSNNKRISNYENDLLANQNAPSFIEENEQLV